MSAAPEPRVQAYLQNGRRRLVRVQANDDYTLLLEYDNGEKRLYDVKPLEGVFAALEPKTVFRRVYIDDCGCVAWDRDSASDGGILCDNRITLCPDSCYLDGKEIK